MRPLLSLTMTGTITWFTLLADFEYFLIGRTAFTRNTPVLGVGPFGRRSDPGSVSGFGQRIGVSRRRGIRFCRWSLIWRRVPESDEGHWTAAERMAAAMARERAGWQKVRQECRPFFSGGIRLLGRRYSESTHNIANTAASRCIPLLHGPNHDPCAALP